MQMFTAALFTIAKTWNEPKCPSMVDWIRKMWYVLTMEYYTFIKKNKVMSFAATWMELETTHNPKQINIETENQIPHVLSCK